ncbi:9867_t:CDS:2, partial [Funneliformis mosseae]
IGALLRSAAQDTDNPFGAFYAALLRYLSVVSNHYCNISTFMPIRKLQSKESHFGNLASKSFKSSLNRTEYKKWVEARKSFKEHDELLSKDQL